MAQGSGRACCVGDGHELTGVVGEEDGGEEQPSVVRASRPDRKPAGGEVCDTVKLKEKAGSFRV